MLGNTELVYGDQLECSREIIKGGCNGPSSANGKVFDSLGECLLCYIKLSFCSYSLVGFPSEQQYRNLFLHCIVTFLIMHSVWTSYLYSLHPLPYCSQRAQIKSRIHTFNLRNSFTGCERLEKEIKRQEKLANHAAYWDWIVFNIC